MTSQMFLQDSSEIEWKANGVARFTDLNCLLHKLVPEEILHFISDFRRNIWDNADTEKHT